MKKIAIPLAIIILGWFLNRPENMPLAQLDRYDKTRLVEQYVNVGGPCEQDKCLVVYVAPWCPSCSALTPMINNLVSSLNREGINATVVIGNDSMGKVLAYSKRYTAPILEDANGEYFDKIGAKGVPYFAVIDRDGKRISDMSGGNTDVGRMRENLDI